jgi:hypothetical protein
LLSDFGESAFLDAGRSDVARLLGATDSVESAGVRFIRKGYQPPGVHGN